MQNQPDWEVQCEGLLQALPPEMEPICDSRGEVKDKIFVCIKGCLLYTSPSPRDS